MRDNQPKHRQLRKEQRKLTRQRANRQGFPAVLIICEGRETEPNYIRGLCEVHRINQAAVTVCDGTHETDAASLVKKARERFQLDPDFDHVYVVCDDDGQSFERALELTQPPLKNRDGRRIAIELVRNKPCFEFWLLLHFEYTARPYQDTAGVLADLRRHLTAYDKANAQIFKQVQTGLDRATAHVKRLKRELAASGANAPDSDMDVLVERLLSMRRSSAP
jgi:hypothetical protein